MALDKQRVLILDDHPQTCCVCRAALEEDGHEVFAFTSLDAAAAARTEKAPALLLVDGGLPGLAEFDLRTLARGARGRERAGIILLVPPRFPDDLLETLRTTCDATLTKPFSVAELRSVVRTVLDRRRAFADEQGRAAESPGAYAATLAPEQTAEEVVGSEIAGCRIERVLGRGASATVYLGRHLMLDVPVAVKLLPVAVARWSADEVERFVRGARAAARIQHPNVAPVLNAGKEEPFYFLIQRYVEGVTLRAKIEAVGRLPDAAVADVLRDIGSGLAEVHGLDVVHRDVKPENIIVTPHGSAVLTDFGLARHVGAGDISSRSDLVGTPYYMSPEQCEGLPLDGRSDLYSLGATAYHALTGRRPVEGETPVAVLRGHIEHRPPSPRLLLPRVSEALADVIMKLLAKRPDERYQTAEALVDSLKRLKLR